MSLQVWLPLNGNVNNQGLSGITMLGSPNSYTATGKIGKCASFAGNVENIIYNNTSDFNYTDNFSYCVWINQNYTGTATQWAFTNGRADYGGYGYGIKISSATNIACFFGTKSINVTCLANEWHHIAVTISGTVMKVYKDGILDSTNSTATLPTYSDGNGLGLGCFHYSGNLYPFYGSLNDFRIYDHCLSPKEVKEISKGLCLHYQLKGFGQENLVKNSGKKIISKNYAVTSYELSEALVLNQIYTITMKAKLTSDLKWIGIWSDYGSTNFAACQARNDDNFYKWTVTCNSSNATHKIFSIYASNNDVGVMQGNTPKTGTCEIEWIKLEEGSKATPWCPNSADSLYSTLGFGSNIELDCSGFGNNGIKTGSIKWNRDTSRYSGSYEFNGTDTSIKNDSDTWHGGTINNKTISCWIKPNGSACGGAGGIMAESMSNAIMSMYNSVWQFTNGSSWVNYSNGGITVGEWSHHACTIKDGVIKIYKNGSLISTNTNTSILTTLSSSNYVAVGCDFPGDDEYFNGLISDFRIYSTALSDSDILELYNTPINIDNKGNLFAYEFIEEEENNFSKQGIAKNSEFIDLDTAGDSYTNASISSTVDYANIFIEK